MPKPVKIQQFHESPKTAKNFIEKSLKDSHSSIAKDYNGLRVGSVRLAKNGPAPVNGRKLYDITLK